MNSSNNGPIKILFTIPNFITAGSGQALLNVVQRLSRDQFEPSICVLKRGGRLEATIKELEIPLYELPFAVAPRPLHDLPFRIWKAAQHFRSYKFTMWHSYHYADDYTEPLISRASGARAWIYYKKNMGWGSRAWRIRTFLATRIAAQNSAMLDQFFSDPRTRRKARQISPGVDIQEFYPGIEPRLNIRQNLGIEKDTFLVGCVAQLVPVKAHAFLIRAIARLTDVHLALAGKPLDEDYAKGLHDLCAELDVVSRVHFLGGVKDIPAFNAELDAFVLPSRMEACPVALLEAMACGLPCIASDIPACREIIEQDVSGLLVTSEDVEALAASIDTLERVAERRRTLGDAARRRVLDRYTIEHEVAALEALYTELVDTH